MHIDPSGLYAAFDKLNAKAKEKGKDLAFVMAGQFLRDMRSEGRKIAPTAEELTEVARRLKGRILRKKGKTPEQELKRRIQAIGIFSRKWKVLRTESRPYQIKIWLIDLAAHSNATDDKFKVSEKAEQKTGKAFKAKLDAMANNLMGGF